MFGYHGAGHHLSGVQHQIFQQCEFRACELNFPVPPSHFPGNLIQLQVGYLKYRAGCVRIAPDESADAGEKFGEDKRFRQIIVGPGV